MNILTNAVYCCALLCFVVSECNDNGAFKSTIMSDEVFDILEKVGYRGVPSRETLASRDAIVR